MRVCVCACVCVCVYAHSGVATPGHTRACAHVKIAGTRVKIMQKAKVKDQLLECAIARFTQT